MAYLRTIASPQIKRRAQCECESCGRRVFSFERYCPYCGLAQPAFDEPLFVRLARSSLREALDWCGTDPEHAVDRVALVELGDANIRYCTVCGRKLDGA